MAVSTVPYVARARRGATGRAGVARRLVVLGLTAVLALVPAAAHASRHESRCAIATGNAAGCAKVEILGHRGIQNANEDTLAALRRDAELGVGFESDTWRLAAADGTPNAGPSVVIHDQTLARTVDPSCLGDLSPDTEVGHVTLRQWRQLCSRGGEHLPTLRQWIRNAGRLGVDGIMEIKWAPADAAKVARWVRASGADISFYAAPHLYQGTCYQTAATAMQAAGMPVGLKANPDCPVSLQEAADLHYGYVIGGPAKDPAYVQEGHDLGLLIGNYNSGSVLTWTELVDAGADIIIAPHPQLLQAWLK